MIIRNTLCTSLRSLWSRTIGLGLLLLLLCRFVPVDAKPYTLNDVPNVRLHDASQYVSDPTAILSTSARDTINAVLSRLEKQTGIETAVVMLPSIGDDDIFEFAHELFRQWGIGKKKSNNGLLVLFVMDQHKVRFTVGYGLEATMTDAMSKRIQMQRMVPRFREGDWDAGMVDGVRAVAQVLDGSMQPETDDTEEDDTLISIVVVVLCVLTFIALIFVVGESQRCPKCRKKGIKRVGQTVIRVGRHRRVRRTTYVCQHCGHTFTRDENINDSGNGAAFVAGSMFGSGRGGGGGFSGGSFGGGSTGGGGATSGW